MANYCRAVIKSPRGTNTSSFYNRFYNYDTCWWGFKILYWCINWSKSSVCTLLLAFMVFVFLQRARKMSHCSTSVSPSNSLSCFSAISPPPTFSSKDHLHTQDSWPFADFELLSWRKAVHKMQGENSVWVWVWVWLCIVSYSSSLAPQILPHLPSFSLSKVVHLSFLLLSVLFQW